VAGLADRPARSPQTAATDLRLSSETRAGIRSARPATRKYRRPKQNVTLRSVLDTPVDHTTKAKHPATSTNPTARHRSQLTARTTD
jgi:hypothetical protein